jgi:hypothetical protein
MGEVLFPSGLESPRGLPSSRVGLAAMEVLGSRVKDGGLCPRVEPQGVWPRGPRVADEGMRGLFRRDRLEPREFVDLGMGQEGGSLLAKKRTLFLKKTFPGILHVGIIPFGRFSRYTHEVRHEATTFL